MNNSYQHGLKPRQACAVALVTGAAAMFCAAVAHADRLSDGERMSADLDRLVEERLARNLVHAMPAIDEWSLIEHWLVEPSAQDATRNAGRVYYTAAYARRPHAPDTMPHPALLFAGRE